MPKTVPEITSVPAGKGAYSLATKAGGFVYTAGRTARTADGGVAAETVGEQTAYVLDRIRLILKDAGASLEDVVKVTVHLTDMANFKEYDEVYSKIMPGPFPVRTTVASTLGKGLLVEIDAVAYVGD